MANRQGDNGQDDGTGKQDKAGGNGDLDARLKQLESKLSGHQKAEEEKEAARSGKSGPGWGHAMKLSSEFIAAVIVGAALGWALDQWAGTSPWGLIILLLLGFAAGVLNVMRATGQVAEFGQGGKKGP